MTQKKNELTSDSRRSFMQKSSIGLAGLGTLGTLPRVHAAGERTDIEIKIGLIGCGGRGTGALLDAVGAATKVIYPELGYHTEDVSDDAKIEKKNIKVVALADLFPDRLTSCHKQLNRLGIEVPQAHRFVGFDAYQRLLEVDEVNYVILATPPHFRPQQFKAAVDAGKHVFMEKPCAVDVPGVKMVMDAGTLARQKNLGVAAGTQRRHMTSYRETIARIQSGAIGDIVYAKCYWNGGQIWTVPRKPGWSDMEWQLRNWNYFTWLSGDHIVEQHVHNLDVMNWVLGSHPIRAVSGLGGRQVRTKTEHGHVFDHFAVEFEYPNGISMFSQCRQINGCRNKVEEAVIGTNGTSNCKGHIQPKSGEPWSYRDRKAPSPYKLEHEHLIDSIRAGSPINEAQSLAESTLTGIIGREAVYSGQTIEWDQAMQSTERLGPKEYALGPYPVPDVALPGIYHFS
jgi:myo-inositol 2-dehydrogenase/D-chiro-inositol 1-dehydrogenase